VLPIKLGEQAKRLRCKFVVYDDKFKPVKIFYARKKVLEFLKELLDKKIKEY
jgi:hypothetical protein